jgi:hypothetical protein
MAGFAIAYAVQAALIKYNGVPGVNDGGAATGNAESQLRMHPCKFVPFELVQQNIHEE